MNREDEDLSARIRAHATRHQAADDLRAAIRTQIALAQAGDALGRPGTWHARHAALRAWLALHWRAATAGFAVGVACAATVLPVARYADLFQPTEAVLVSRHVQALRVGPLIEVASSDRHTVKPWFQGKLDYAPPVPDLQAEGFPLAGGRIEQVAGQPVAALTYTRNRHVVDVFVWPSDGAQPLTRRVHRGFSVLRWSDASMQYWAVSDLDAMELDRFARLWRSASEMSVK